MAGALVDILLPTHERPHTVAFAVESVRRQTLADWRLHVVGDGCDDATEAVVRAIDDPRIAFHRLPKAPGFGYANRNRVLQATSAPFVAYMSDDDLWFPDHLEVALAALRDETLTLVASSTLAVRPPGQLDPHFFAHSWSAPGLRALRHWFLGAPNLVHRRELFERLGYWREDLLRFGDREFYNRARASGLGTRLLPDRTLLRFFAQQWSPLYATLDAPPQGAFLQRLSEPGGAERVRAEAAALRLTLSGRRTQVADFTRFLRRSGPRFLRFAWARRRSGPPR